MANQMRQVDVSLTQSQFLIIFVKIYLMSSQKIRVRKDVRLLGKNQRDRFFFCLKFLSVIPPQQAGNLRNFHVVWKVENDQRFYKIVKPRNIHDQFIASHQTCCEHGNIYFAYYHRNLLTSLEIALNFAEEILLGGKDRISSLYSLFPKQFDLVFQRYKVTIDSLRKQLGLKATDDLPLISIHYWNPVDYTSDISIPQELRQHSPDEMDSLYFAVNRHYPWSFNFATRWFSEGVASQPKLPVNFETMGFFLSQFSDYSPDQKQIVYGNLNPRSTSNDLFFGISNIDNFGMTALAARASDINMYKNYQKLKATGSTVDVCTLDQAEMNTLFGSKVKNLHWLSNAQRKVLGRQNSIKAYSYNKALPHFQFAQALFKKSNQYVRDYISTQGQYPENSMENAHNTMHNIMQLFMSDSQLSITNPIFFLYHSWIDYQIQLKIRLIRTGTSNNAQFINSRSFLDGRVKPFSVLDQVSNKGQIRYGDYYIFEWANPLTRFYPQFNQPLTKNDYQVAFKTRNFIINEEAKGLRRSDQLTSFYRKQYLPSNGSRYNYYKNFSKFDFNYDYEILDYDSTGKRVSFLMTGKTVPIHSYLAQIGKDYDADWNQNRANSLATAPTLNSSPSQNKKLFYDRKSLLKAVRINFGGFATYSTSIKSAVVPIRLQLTEKGEKLLNLQPQFADILKQGVVISVASLFTRGVASTLCPNCKDQKELIMNGSEQLAEICPQLYCDLSLSLTKDIIYKKVQGKVVYEDNIKLTQIFKLTTPKPVFNRLELIEGANEVDFLVKFKGPEDYETSQITLTLYNYSMQENKFMNRVSSKKDTLDGITFQFPRVSSIGSQIQSACDNPYKKIQGLIVNGNQRCEFSFQINATYRLVTYLILIEQKEYQNGQAYIDVEIRDKDYQFKIKQYRSYEMDEL